MPIATRKKTMMAAALALSLAAAPLLAAPAAPRETIPPGDDWRLTGTFGYGHSSGNYGTSRDTSVDLGLPALSLSNGDFRFTASVPYLRIDGRGLVVFDASGNPIVINRRSLSPPGTRSGWGDLNLSASYTLPSGLLNDLEVRVSAVTKVPVASARRRLSTGKADFGMSVDISRRFGAWTPFVTVGYLSVGQPVGYTLYDTTSVSLGSSVELSDELVAIASYDHGSADGPLVPDAQNLSASLSWMRGDNVTLTGYGTVGLSKGSPDMGVGLLISYGLD